MTAPRERISPLDRIYVAIDRRERAAAAADVARLPGACIKLGLEFFVGNGPDGVRDVAAGRLLFLDLKLHDIPNTVAGGVRSACALRPRLLTIHASGGKAMMQAAAAAAREAAGEARPRLIGITVLTSLDDTDLGAVGQCRPVGDQVRRLAALARESGLDGVVCSALEIEALRAECGPGFLLVVPGIRPTWAAANDQKRVMTPAEAIARGADCLVVGRPITADRDPSAALARVADEVARAA